MKKLTFLTAILIASLSFAQIPSYMPTTGLVGWWPFNGNANDESGNGNNGTVNGATLTTDRNGVLNKAYSFNGLNSGILIPNSNNSMIDNFTISFWIKNNLIINHLGAHIWHKPDGSLTFGISGDNTISFGKQGVQLILTSNTILQNNWTHIVFTKSGDFHKLFINGTIDNIVNLNINLSSSINQPIKVGYASQGGNNGSYRFDGNLDEFSTWNRVLSNCEIQDLYHSQFGYSSIEAGSNQSVCAGNPVTLTASGAATYSWNNNVINAQSFTPTITQNYILTGTDSIGCAGSDTVEVAVLESTSSSQTQTALDAYTWPINNQTYTQSGTYSDTLVNAAGCDSIVT
ncbi:MAG: LamG domain-containing protein, partial [Crocinitomicaceae bacterium]|nr:LamG domain-containing protein [Crocinitomicaceae bacterium]